MSAEASAAAEPTATRRTPAARAAAVPEAAAESGAPRQAPLWLVVLLGALVLVAAAAVVLAATLPARSGSAGERDRALAAAKSEVPLILSYNYASFDADLAKAKAQLTGRAVSDYVTAMNQTIKPAAIKVKAVVQAQTDGAGVESVSPDGRQVIAVVFGEQKVTNTSLSAPRTDLFRVRATLDLVGGRWLISKFDQI
jgi:Mce-associated membrane protein